MKIGLVGVGELGFAIGANMLEAGHELLVYDVRPQGIEVALWQLAAQLRRRRLYGL
jgi:3-hydroxyisobutyrate dehydrogenase-like beta-hydroxyacid dehydrogenase